MDEKIIVKSRLESILKLIMDKNEAVYHMIYISLLNGKDYFYYVFSKRNGFVIKYVCLDKNYSLDKINNVDFRKKYMKKILLKNEYNRLKSFINYVYNYQESNKEFDLYTINDNIFYVYIPAKDVVYSFNSKSTNYKYNAFYDLVNYLFSYSKLNINCFTRLNNGKSIFDRCIVLDDEITKYVNKNKIKLDELKKTNYPDLCNDICSMMNNYDLISCICFCDYVYILGDAIKKIVREPFDWVTLLYDKNVRREVFINLINNKEFILTRDLTNDKKELILKNADIDHQITMLLNIMTNEEIIDLSNQTHNWNVKLDLMKYINSSKE